jgi:hypothetical protein
MSTKEKLNSEKSCCHLTFLIGLDFGVAGLSQAWGWGAKAPPVFGQTVNPISTRGVDYAHHSTTSLPGFSDLATALSCSILS